MIFGIIIIFIIIQPMCFKLASFYRLSRTYDWHLFHSFTWSFILLNMFQVFET